MNSGPMPSPPMIPTRWATFYVLSRKNRPRRRGRWRRTPVQALAYGIKMTVKREFMRSQGSRLVGPFVKRTALADYPPIPMSENHLSPTAYKRLNDELEE